MIIENAVLSKLSFISSSIMYYCSALYVDFTIKLAESKESACRGGKLLSFPIKVSSASPDH